MNPNPADEILPNLWLGNIKAATDPKWLGERGIKCVFNCTKDIVFVPTTPRQYGSPAPTPSPRQKASPLNWRDDY